MRAVPNAGSGSEITPFATTFGDVGAAIIEWTNSSQVWWELSPYDSGALIGFTGRVTIEKFAASGKYTRVWTDPVDSGGIGAISGTVSVPYLHEGSYRATLGGSGTVGLTFYIVQGCNASRYIIR